MKKSTFIALSLFFSFDNFVHGQNSLSPSGNVGIGTTSPQQQLHVVGTSLFNGTSIIEGGNQLRFWSATDGPYFTESFGIRAYPHYNSHAFMIMNQPLFVGYQADGADLDNDDGSLMVSNRMGIGTKTPSRKLSLNSLNATTLVDVGLYQDGVEKAAFGAVGAANEFFTGTAAGDLAIRATTGKLHLGANSGTSAPGATILQNGNFGIGTITPSARFHNNGTVRFQGLANNDALTRILVSDVDGNMYYRNLSSLNLSGGSGWAIGGNTVGSLTTIGTVDNYDLPIITNNMERIRISNNGLVGIGTSSPQSALHLKGGYTQTSDLYNGTLVISHTANETIEFIHSGIGTILKAGPDNVVRFGGQQINASERGAYLSNSLSGFSLQTAEGSVVLNTISGSTLIGTNVLPASDAKLAVKGIIYAQKIKVTQTGWADYVFGESYRLRPLTEVEKFIALNHHLPEVPSAAQVEKDGLDLGSNQATLLQKIEELTLYLIEQNKKLESQQNQINDLKTELKLRK